MRPEEKLKSLGLSLPQAAKPMGSYAAVVEQDKIIYMSGVLPRQGDKVAYTGKLGADVSLEEGSAAAKLCILNALAVLQNQYGSLDKIEKVLRLTGYVQSHTGFYDQPKVLNGASDLLAEIFGDAGVHARSAVGVAALPANAACELELTLKLK